MKDLKIRYKLLKIGNYVNTMASVFNSAIEGFEESDLSSEVELEGIVSDIIVRDIKQEELDVIKFEWGQSP